MTLPPLHWLPYREAMAEPQPYRPDRAILTLGEGYFAKVAAANFPKTTLRFANRRWAAQVGLDNLDEVGWARHFGRFEPLADNLPTPLALRYHGHQFRHYNPDIGDGRGFLFAQLRDGAKASGGRLLDLGTKGSGQTPYSRFGDGRLTLKGGVREVLATEMLEALGVSTSKSFALIETGEQLTRGDEPSPTRSAVLTRLSHGHVRIGSFQRLAYEENAAEIAALVRYCLRQLFGEDSDDPLRLFELAATQTARLAASYLAAGFVHGVLNSDNINITGESFDYGPWRFAPIWDEDFVAAYFDHGGLYAFGRQPEAIHWDLAQLGGCLALVADGPALAEILSDWQAQFEAALVAALVRRLGIAPDAAADRDLVSALLVALRAQSVTIDRLFFDWRGGRVPDGESYRDAAFVEMRERLASRAPLPHALDHDYWCDDRPCSMHIDEVEAIWAAIADQDDWAPFENKIAAIRRMGAAHDMTP
ncbi:MAG: YdiU family protein [Sphingomonas bacterium]|nr:YdiU family protein [Sphingomonas bacterium]